MSGQWRNWSGSVVFQPARLHHPDSEERLAALVGAVAARDGQVRAVGAGHSSNGLVRCEDTLLSMERMSGVLSVDRSALTATVRAGTTLEDLGRELYEHDLALPNYGDVATQTIGGAIGTGTHGTGRRLHNLSHMLIGARVVDGRGEVRQVDDEETLRAMRVALGTFGIFSEVTLRVVPSFDVERREFAIATDAAMEQLDDLASRNRSLDFYWYPRRDDIKLRLVNAAGGTSVPDGARELTRLAGYGHEVIPTHSGIPHRFDECEYALPAENGPACFQAVRARVLKCWRAIVGWRVLYRTIAADDTWLSPATGRDTVTISLHQNSTLPWSDYFRDVETIFREFDGRPHWAKKHTASARRLEPMYPRWRDFLRLRAQFDPKAVFLTPYLRELLGVPA
ncbi:MAG TPA: D-arabinono-1,4-lactone oxidase [Lysobacter sp.]